MKTILYSCLITLLLSSYAARGQQQSLFTQYMFNKLAINPAYAGSHESMSATVLLRNQWSGIEGAPNTQTFALHTPFINNKLAAGVVLIHDVIGVTEQYGLFGSYAYRIPFKTGTLSLGLQAGIVNVRADYTSLEMDDDPEFSQNINETAPNFGFGVFYKANHFYFGLSVPQIRQYRFDTNDANDRDDMLRHYFLQGGYIFDIHRSVKLKPNFLIKYVDGAPLQFDINMNALFHEVLWLGLSYRSLDSFDALVSIQVSDQLQVGYAYDFATVSELSRVNSGSHELMINYRFRYAKTQVVTPRYF